MILSRRWEFTATTLLICALLQVSMDPRPARAEIVPARGALDGRIRSAPYDADQVYRLRGFVGYQIDLQFELGEKFVGIGAGDMEGLSYFGQDNHLFLKPKAANVATNLTVITNRRQYQFDYAVLAERPSAGDPNVIYVLRFIYPPVASGLDQDAAAREIDSELANASNKRRQNFDYWYCGDSTLRPVLASDDGVQTRMRFAANADLPAIFVRGDDETESLLNYSVESGDIIIHRVARRFVVRRGSLAGCVVNKGFSGGGLRLDSGTVDPEVERRLHGGQP